PTAARLLWSSRRPASRDRVGDIGTIEIRAGPRGERMSATADGRALVAGPRHGCGLSRRPVFADLLDVERASWPQDPRPGMRGKGGGEHLRPASAAAAVSATGLATPPRRYRFRVGNQ